MALTGIFNTNNREMVLSRSQAQAFNQTIQYFRTNGVGGDNVFEDTYVLQKMVAEYIKENVGENELINPIIVNEIYGGVLGLTPQPVGDTSPDDMEADEYSSPTPPSSISTAPESAQRPAPVAPAQVSAPASPLTTGGVGGSIGGRNFGGESI